MSYFTNIKDSPGEEKISKIAKARIKYELYRRKVYYFLERPHSRLALGYHSLNLLLIVGSLVISVLSTIKSLQEDAAFISLVFYCELSLLTWFIVEYLIRLWSCSFLGKYRGFSGKLRFATTFYMMIDAFVIISTLTTILVVTVAYVSILRITRFLQIFRILRLDRQRGDLGTMGRVVYKHRKELVTCYFVGFIILFGGTYIVYIAEKSSKDAVTIDNMANGLYWAMITVTSVGYGDISPKTMAGKIITGVFALVGCAFFALPSGILGSGFALQVAKQKKQQRYVKVRNPAAIVIQTCWRSYSVKPRKYELQYTWKMFFPQIIKQQNKVSPPAENHDYYKLNTVAEYLHPLLTLSPVHQNGEDKNQNRLNKFVSMIKQVEVSKPNTATKTQVRGSRGYSRRRRSDASSAGNQELVSNMIKKHYKHAIRFILRLKFNLAIKQFKNIRYPFVNVQDIMEKNALCHTETMSHLKSIQDGLQELRTELNSMKKVLYGRKSAITSGQTPVHCKDSVSPRAKMESDLELVHVHVEHEGQVVRLNSTDI